MKDEWTSFSFTPLAEHFSSSIIHRFSHLVRSGRADLPSPSRSSLGFSPRRYVFTHPPFASSLSHPHNSSTSIRPSPSPHTEIVLVLPRSSANPTSKEPLPPLPSPPPSRRVRPKETSRPTTTTTFLSLSNRRGITLWTAERTILVVGMLLVELGEGSGWI